MVKKEKKLYEGIVDDLMHQIQSGNLCPGTKLPAERTLSQEYGVSRAVVREAFRAMEKMGCVESRVGGGTFVKTPTLSDVVDPYSLLFIKDEKFTEELIETRIFLETEVARLAADRRTDEQVKQLKKTIANMRKDLANGKPCEKNDVLFHTQLLKAANNRALELVISTCSEIINRTVQATQQVAGAPEQAMKDHEQILKAIIDGDSATAEKHMRNHLVHTKQNLEKAMIRNETSNETATKS